MGTIVGIGGGGYQDGDVAPIIKHIVSLCGKKNPKVLFVPTAGFDDMNGDEAVFELFEGFGCSVSPLLLAENAPGSSELERIIMGSDIIYAGGGNLKFLMDTWNRTGVSEIFKRAYERGILLSGYSSGSMCWFSQGYDDCGENHDFMFVDCLGLLEFCNCPHFESGGRHSFEAAVKSRNISGIALENGAAIVFDNGKIYAINGTQGGKAWFFDGENGFKKSEIAREIDA